MVLQGQVILLLVAFRFCCGSRYCYSLPVKKLAPNGVSPGAVWHAGFREPVRLALFVQGAAAVVLEQFAADGNHVPAACIAGVAVAARG